jgi:hypothetical protein
MSNKKTSTPNVEVRRRNNNRNNAPTPAEELKEVLDRTAEPLSEPEHRERDLVQEAAANAAAIGYQDATVAASSAVLSGEDAQASIEDATIDLSTAGKGISAEEVNVLVAASREEEIGKIIREASNKIHTRPHEIPDLHAFVCDLVARLEPFQVYPSNNAWIANQPFYKQNLILVVTRFPKSVPDIPEQMLKTILELHPFRIDGLKRGYRLETKTGAKADYCHHESSVSMSFGEKSGRSISRMFETWGERIGGVGINENATIDFMLIEPDPTHTKVVDAWHCKGMYPHHCSSIDGERNLSLERSPQEIVVDWAGSVTRSREIDQRAQDLLNGLQIMNADPFLASPIEQEA